MVAPIDGVIKKSRSGQLTITTGFGPFSGKTVVIDNIRPKSKMRSNTRVYAGQRIGQATRSFCQPNSIHVTVLENDSEHPNATSKPVDPSTFVNRLKFPFLKSVQGCDDYRLVVMGYTVSSGKLSTAIRRAIRKLKEIAKEKFIQVKNYIKAKLKKKRNGGDALANVNQTLQSIRRQTPSTARSPSTENNTEAFEKSFEAPKVEFPVYDDLPEDTVK